jgi:hypothetical protein
MEIKKELNLKKIMIDYLEMEYLECFITFLASFGEYT